MKPQECALKSMAEMRPIKSLKAIACALGLVVAPATAHAQSAEEELAKQLSNPIAALISVLIVTEN